MPTLSTNYRLNVLFSAPLTHCLRSVFGSRFSLNALENLARDDSTYCDQWQFNHLCQLPNRKLKQAEGNSRNWVMEAASSRWNWDPGLWTVGASWERHARGSRGWKVTKWAGEQSDGGITCGRLHTGEKFWMEKWQCVVGKWEQTTFEWMSGGWHLLSRVRWGEGGACLKVTWERTRRRMTRSSRRDGDEGAVTRGFVAGLMSSWTASPFRSPLEGPREPTLHPPASWPGLPVKPPCTSQLSLRLAPISYSSFLFLMEHSTWDHS